MALSFPDKDPEEVLDYPTNFTDWLVTGCDIDGTEAVILNNEF